MRKRRVTPGQRALVEQRRLRAEGYVPGYSRALIRSRNAELQRIQKQVSGLPAEQVPEAAYDAIDESYLYDFFRQLYLSVGVPGARWAVNDFLSRKATVDETPRWERLVSQFIENHIGEKIILVQGTFKEYVRDQLRGALLIAPGQSIEARTRHLFRQLENDWNQVKDWQVRRIVHTETMQALAVGQYESMQELDLDYNKVWTATFINTPDQHADMDGIEVGQNEFFILPNGDQMLYPHDSAHGAGPENLINCRCGTYDVPI